MAFDSLRRSTEASTDLILDRVEDRVKRGIAEEKEVNRTFGIVGTAMNKSKSATVRKIDEANAKGVNFLRSKDGLAFCKKLSNPWTAWGKTGPLDGDQDAQLRSNLQSILKPSDNKAVNQARRYARQVWRTEMTEYIIKKANEKTGNPPAPNWESTNNRISIGGSKSNFFRGLPCRSTCNGSKSRSKNQE